MVDPIQWKPTAPYDFGETVLGDAVPGPLSPDEVRAQAIQLLRERGFVYAGEDSVGLPCYRSRSGAMLIGVGSCRSLAYAMVEGRLQVVAASRTLALLCRIVPDALPVDGWYRAPKVAPARVEESHRPEPVLVI